MDLNRVQIFYHVAKAGSLTKAAKSLNTSQSALSKQITTLEYRLKVKLFERTYGGLKLTKEGEKLFGIAQKLVAEASNIETSLFEKKEEAKGTVTIATTKALASMWLPYYLKGFFEEYPNIKLSIIGDDSELDLNIRKAEASIRPFIPYQQGYIQRYLMTFNLRLYASPEYLDKFGIPKTVEELDNHRLITFGDNATHPYGNINWLLNVGEKTQKSRVPFMKINIGSGILQMARQGIGIVALSKEYLGITEANLINILPEIEGPSVEIYYIYPEQFKGYKRVEALGDYLESFFTKERNQNGPQ